MLTATEAEPIRRQCTTLVGVVGKDDALQRWIEARERAGVNVVQPDDSGVGLFSAVFECDLLEPGPLRIVCLNEYDWQVPVQRARLVRVCELTLQDELVVLFARSADGVQRATTWELGPVPSAIDVRWGVRQLTTDVTWRVRRGRLEVVRPPSTGPQHILDLGSAEV